MNRPWLSVEAILEQFRLGVGMSSDQPATAHYLQWLAEFLTREHATMNAEDWEALVYVGRLLWQDEETRVETTRIR
jgi:hypothetical protein